jgi:ABC-type phosphate/phosphonate transport system substrate-binding protein
MFNARVDLPDEQRKAFVDALMKMSWDNPVHRPILEAEGLKAWIEPHTDGYDALRDAAGEVGLLDRG